ncbi:MAG: AAA family ATPase [Fusobacteriaceae bacterium]
MKIKEINLKNFRCYENLKISLDDRYTLLIGSNGAGKTTILDAISIALGGYVSYFDTSNYGIIKDDSLYKMYELGSKIERTHQFPVCVKATGEIQGSEAEWERVLKSEKGRTSNLNLKDITRYTSLIFKKISNGDKDLILPIVAYYGTGRLWMQKRDKKNKKSDYKISRLKGYLDCLSPISNEKIMLKWFEEMTYIRLQEGKVIPELEVVERAVAQCYQSIDNNIKSVNVFFNVKNKELEITVKYFNNKIENLPLRLLSDGIKSTLSMVADIAYRMAILNPQLLEDIKEKTPGVILIDEIDMHLHPAWQKKIIDDLCRIFPSVQFIFTTHSPTVLSNVYAKHIRILNTENVEMTENTTYGRDIDAVLREIMGMNTKPQEILTLIDNIYNDIDNENLESSKEKLKKLEEIVGSQDEEVIKAQVSIDFEEKILKLENECFISEDTL